MPPLTASTLPIDTPASEPEVGDAPSPKAKSFSICENNSWSTSSVDHGHVVSPTKAASAGPTLWSDTMGKAGFA